MLGIKRAIKSILDNKTGDSFLTCDSSKITEEYVSFDIFDTLIKRDVNHPTDVFTILEKQLAIPGFAKKRVNAEMIARSKSPNGEVMLQDIYRCIDGIPSEEISAYCRKELDAEKKVCHPNNKILPFYRECVRNKPVVLVSDMYMTSDMIVELLDKCGISGYKRLYVSCEIGVSKHDGEIYRYVLEDLGISARQMRHIGNDFIADIQQAKKVGVGCKKIKTKADNLLVSGAPENRAKKDAEFSLIYNFINNTTCSNERFNDFYYRFGYENFGILLMGFMKWLIGRMETQGIAQVLFVARDGHVLKQAYEAMGYDKRIPAYYFEVSRRSIRVPASFSLPHSYEESIQLVNAIKRISIGQILDTWGLDIDSVEMQLEKAGIAHDRVFWKDELSDSDELRRLYSIIKDTIVSNAISEKQMLYKYIDQFDFSKRTALVDIGYGGTIQKELLKLFDSRGIRTDIYGYYLFFETTRLTENTNGLPVNIEGYFYSDYKIDNRSVYLNPYVGLFETMFLEQVGSVKRYVDRSEGIVIERYCYEYDASGGEVNETERVKQVQQGAIGFISDAKTSIVERISQISPVNAFFLLNRAFSHPTEAILRHFYNFRFFNLGKGSFLAKPRMKLNEYVLHPNCLREDFFDSMWKYGFIRKLVGFNAPYGMLKEVYVIINNTLHGQN